MSDNFEDKNENLLGKDKNASFAERNVNAEQLPKQPKQDDFDNDGIYSGVSLNDILNKNKKRDFQNFGQDEEEKGFYATNLINDIKKRNAKRARRFKITILIIIGVALLTVLVLFGFLPDLQNIVPID